ncbi:MAG: hypothetical protein GY869_01425, partial [Planctomycetes bacterium]|nr:hypothetical protein [Planctomycetota bacterium]
NSNSADTGGGGGVYNYLSDSSVTNCTFNSNSAGRWGEGWGGGGISNYLSDSSVTSCTFSSNSAGRRGGGGISNYLSDPSVTSCTFSSNFAEMGGGMSNLENSSPTVKNCIFWGNIVDPECNMADDECNDVGFDNSNSIFNFRSDALISYCDIAGCGGSGGGWNDFRGTDGGGNIDEDPVFADPNDNLRLLPGSPCIDAGDSNSVGPDLTDLDGDGDPNEPIPFDIDGLPRFYDDPNTIDTGNGTPPIVDMGAHEFIPCDFQPDGRIDELDFITFILYWLETGCGRCGGADLTGEGNVDLADVAKFGALWQAGV